MCAQPHSELSRSWGRVGARKSFFQAQEGGKACSARYMQDVLGKAQNTSFVSSRKINRASLSVTGDTAGVDC